LQTQKTWQITHLDLELTKEVAKEFSFGKSMLGLFSFCFFIAAVNQLGDIIKLNSLFWSSRIFYPAKLSKSSTPHTFLWLDKNSLQTKLDFSFS